MNVSFRKQGGNASNGQAIGRMGSQLLIRYRITNGEPRERWIPADRVYSEIDRDAWLALPRYRREACPGVLQDPASYSRCSICRAYRMPGHKVVVRVEAQP